MNAIRPPFVSFGTCDSEYWQSRNLETNHSPEQYLKADITTQLTLDKIIEVSNKATSFIEIGCNAGRNLNYLYNKGFKNLAGIEINEIAINQTLKTNFPDLYNSAKFYIGNAATEITKIPDNSFDVVFSIAVLIHIDPEYFSLFSDMARISKKYIAIMTAENGSPFPYNFKKIFADLGFKEIYYRCFYGEKNDGLLPIEKYNLKEHLFNETFVRIFVKCQ
ncbi:MAG TPA: methyltransferase domain-containing protein [bacterium]|nr:methyltransferase domain-containing protein [bacterium]HPP87689.1 methyltransferase domain-containing protein [bacterium]